MWLNRLVRMRSDIRRALAAIVKNGIEASHLKYNYRNELTFIQSYTIRQIRKTPVTDFNELVTLA